VNPPDLQVKWICMVPVMCGAAFFFEFILKDISDFDNHLNLFVSGGCV